MKKFNRQQRRDLKNRIASIANKIAELENNISKGINKEENEAEMTRLISRLSMGEMVAIEDYIFSKNLLIDKK